MENFKNEKSPDTNFMSVPKGFVYLGAGSVALNIIHGALVLGQGMTESAKLMPAHPEGPFKIENVTRTDIKLSQEGKDYVLKVDQLPPDVKASLIKQNPNLEAFLTNGPINIINTGK